MCYCLLLSTGSGNKAYSLFNEDLCICSYRDSSRERLHSKKSAGKKNEPMSIDKVLMGMATFSILAIV